MRGCMWKAEEEEAAEKEEAEGCCGGSFCRSPKLGCGRMGFKSCVGLRCAEQQGRW